MTIAITFIVAIIIIAIIVILITSITILVIVIFNINAKPSTLSRKPLYDACRSFLFYSALLVWTCMLQCFFPRGDHLFSFGNLPWT